MKEKCECSICENHEYDMENRMTLKETKEYIRGDKTFLDKRKCVLTFYEFCPFCGEKINWKEIKKDI